MRVRGREQRPFPAYGQITGAGPAMEVRVCRSGEPGGYAMPTQPLGTYGRRLGGEDRITEEDAAVLIPSRQFLAIGTEYHRVYFHIAKLAEGCRRLTGGGIPQVRTAIVVTGRHGGAVRAERDRDYAAAARVGEGRDRPTGGHIPQVRADLAVRAERDRIRTVTDGVGEGGSLGPGGDIPQIRVAAVIGGGQGLAVRAERDRGYARAAETAGAAGGGDIPQADLLRDYGQRGAGRAEGQCCYRDETPGGREIDRYAPVARRGTGGSGRGATG